MNAVEAAISGVTGSASDTGRRSTTSSILNIPGQLSHQGSLCNIPAANSRRESLQIAASRLSKKILFEDEVDQQPIQHSKRLNINICGRRFDVPQHILLKHPETLLGDPLKIQKYYDADRDEYYFNRNRGCFESILQYYQSGILRRPHNLALDTFVAEATFFEIGRDALLQFCRDEGFEREEPEPLPENPVLRRIWQLVELPQSSPAAKLFAILSMTVILVSIIVFCIETLPEFHNKHEVQSIVFRDRHGAHLTMGVMNGSTVAALGPDEVKISRGYSQFQEPLFIIETICIAWFTIEFLVRLISCPDKKSFFKSPLNIIDLIAIIPYYIDLSITLANIASGKDTGSLAGSLAVLRILRLVRVFRIFKLSRHSKGLQILGKTFVTSARELGLLLLFLSIGVVLFSSAVFYAEQGVTESQFQSIPEGFWWAIVTMTTVGYGDIAPTGVFGKMVGTACAVSGLIAIALPVPVIVANFNTIYQRERDRPQVEEILNDALSVSDNTNDNSNKIYKPKTTNLKSVQGTGQEMEAMLNNKDKKDQEV